MVYNDFDIKITSIAQKDLEDIFQYIINDLNNRQAASKMYKRIYESFGLICRFPYSGVLVNNERIITNNVRKMIVDDYIIYYFVELENKTVIILRISNRRMNQEKISLT